MPTPKSIALIGAGLAGSLLAIFLARRGLRVTVYERNRDMRRHETPAGRSINLALAHRGIRALHAVGLDEQVRKLIIPMRGRMLHAPDRTLSLAHYGRTPTEVINSISRPGLNRLLMNAAETAGVRFPFEKRCEDLDFDTGTLNLHDDSRHRKYTVPASRIIATDGGGSAVR